MMNQQTLTHFRQRLLDMDRSITEDVGAMREQTLQPSGGQTAGEISNAPMHLGDRGTEEYLNQLSTTLLSNEESLVNEVRDALARIDAGVYGNCEECGREIAHERLEALPFTNLCIHCASKSSRPTANLNTGRPRNPDDTLAPEGEMGESRRSTQGQFRESPMQISQEGQRADSDSHAVGTPGRETRGVGWLAAMLAVAIPWCPSWRIAWARATMKNRKRSQSSGPVTGAE